MAHPVCLKYILKDLILFQTSIDIYLTTNSRNYCLKNFNYKCSNCDIVEGFKIKCGYCENE